MSKRLPFHTLCLFAVFLCSCNSSTMEDIQDSLQEPDRQTIDRSIMGVNAFVNDARFGSIGDQFLEVRDKLRLAYVRVLLNWNEQVQPAESAAPDFSFYDSIIANLPGGVRGLVVLNGLPSWAGGSGPARARNLFVSRWVRAVFERYGQSSAVEAFQIWNEPNDQANPENSALAFIPDAANYAEVLARAQNLRDQYAPGKLLVSAATTSINQNFPDSLDYNRALRDAGAQQFIDVWALHYYGKQYENVLRGGGSAGFRERAFKAGMGHRIGPYRS